MIGKTANVSEIDSKTRSSENVASLLRSNNNKLKNASSNTSIGTSPRTPHKLGELPNYLRNKGNNKNNSLLAKTKREFDAELLKLCEAQTNVIALQRTYQDLQKDCGINTKGCSDDLKLIALKNNNDDTFRVVTKFNFNEENYKKIIGEKLKKYMDLIIEENNKIILDLVQTFDNEKVVITIKSD